MAQEYFKLGGVTVRQPDTFKVNFATTSTSDSGRNQYLTMLNVPIGTVHSYTVGWDYLTLSEMSTILKQILGKASYTAHYCDAYDGVWKDATFYTANIESAAKTLKDGKEMWKDLSFQMGGIDPI